MKRQKQASTQSTVESFTVRRPRHPVEVELAFEKCAFATDRFWRIDPKADYGHLNWITAWLTLFTWPG